MLSLRPPRCRFSLPIAFSGSGDPRSLSWPGPSRRVGCSSGPNRRCGSLGLRRKAARVRSVGKEEAELRTSSVVEEEEGEEKRGEYEDVDPQDLEYVRQIRRVLELLKKNRDMIFSEVKLTIMIEDPREVERRRLLGIEDPDAPTRDDLVEALVQVNEGKVPEDRLALKMLAEEMLQWPNLEEAAPKEARQITICKSHGHCDETEVPPAVGYGALYLVTAFPVIIGISVVLILFYNSLQ
ncbi:hypothetical protein NL676_007631 [Syzygium grande]|nr:hypothetical protein NL676_007631 [Syzygium grande]